MELFNDISAIRRLVTLIIQKLEQEIIHPGTLEEQELARLWGKKESLVSVVADLSQILIKLLPLKNPEEDISMKELLEQDKKILHDYDTRKPKA